MSRAKWECKIYTDNKEKLLKDVEKVIDKGIAVESVRGIKF